MTRTQTGTPVCVGGACCPTCQPPRAAARTKCMELLSLMRMRACRLLSRANTRVSRMRRQRFEERAQAAQNAAGRRLLELMAHKRSNLAVAADVADPAALLRLADQVATPGSHDRVWFGLGPHLMPYVVPAKHASPLQPQRTDAGPRCAPLHDGAHASPPPQLAAICVVRQRQRGGAQQVALRPRRAGHAPGSSASACAVSALRACACACMRAARQQLRQHFI